MEKLSEQELIDQGRAAHEFLRSDAGKSLVERRNMDYFRRWQIGKTVTEREEIYAEMRAFNTMVVDMEAQESAGQMAQYQRDTKDKQAEQEEKLYGKNRNKNKS